MVAIARHPEVLADCVGAQVIQGTPYEYATVQCAMPGCDAVINVLNVSRTSDNPWAALAAPPDLISRACENALEAMQAFGVKRYVALSAVGAGDSHEHLFFVVRWLVRYSNLKVAFEDHGVQERLLFDSTVDYTIARAPMLNDSEPTDVLVSEPGAKMNASISRQAVAQFFLSIVESGANARQVIHISGS
jgi:uncharacterized protein YbjT (DUF2867 family)